MTSESKTTLPGEGPRARNSGRLERVAGVILVLLGLGIVAWWSIEDRGQVAQAPMTEPGADVRDAPARDPAAAAVREGVGVPATPESALLCRIVAKHDGRPLEGAVVEVQGIDAAPARAATDAAGAAAVPMPLDGVATLRVFREGFVTRSIPWTALSFTAPREAQIDLDKAGEIHVSVRRTTGEAVEGALAEVFSEPVNSVTPAEWPLLVPADATHLLDRPNAQVAETDSAGRMVLRKLPCGVPIWVRVKGDFLPQKRPVTIDPATGAAELHFHVESAGLVRGRVVDDDGRPLPRVDVRLTMDGVRLGDLSPLQIAVTDAEGRYRMGGLPRTHARVNAILPESTSVEVELDGSHQELPDIVASKGLDVGGRLVSRHGLAAPSRLVVVQSKDDRPVASGDVWKDGSFLFPSTVKGGELGILYRVLENGVNRHLGSVPIELALRTEAISVDAWMAAIEWEFEGSPFEDGTQLRIALVPQLVGGRFAEPSNPSILRCDLGLRGGKAAIGGIPAGRYSILVEVAGRGAKVFPGVDLEAGGIARLVVDSLDVGSLEVECSDSHGLPIVARVVAESAGGAARLGSTDPNGRFSASALAPGSWRVRAEEIGAPRGRLPRRSEPTVVAVGPRAHARVALRLLAPPRVLGIVKDAAGLPLTGAQVALQAKGRGRVADRITGPDGRFAYEDVEPGTYSIAAPAGDGAAEVREIDVEPGSEVLVEFSAYALPWRARFVRDGTPVNNLTSVGIVEAGLRSRRGGRVAPNGTVELPAPRATPVLVLGHRQHVDPTLWDENEFVVAPVESGTGGLPEVLEVRSSTLTVALQPGPDAWLRPRLVLRSVRGIELTSPVALRGIEDDLGVRTFRGVPCESMVELTGKHPESGAELTKRIEIGFEGVETTWP